MRGKGSSNLGFRILGPSHDRRPKFSRKGGKLGFSGLGSRDLGLSEDGGTEFSRGDAEEGAEVDDLK